MTNPVVQLESPTPLSGRRFVRRFLLWQFLLLLPANLATDTASIYTHEFAHGAAALVSGGYFIGVKAELLNPQARFAFADAWSDDHELLVRSAGIFANVVLGSLFLWFALRAQTLVPRLFLLVAAGNFLLGDLAYAVEGCFSWKTADNWVDMAYLLRQTDSTVFRWVCTSVLCLGLFVTTLMWAKGLFRCWERVFGYLRVRRTFCVTVLLVNVLHVFPSTEGDPRFGFLLGLVCQLGLTAYLVCIRKRDPLVEKVPERSLFFWTIMAWLSGGLAITGLFWLQRGIYLGISQVAIVTDIRPEEQVVAGYAVQYELSNFNEEYRKARGIVLFAAREKETKTMQSPAEDVLDVAWLSSDRLGVVCGQGILIANLSTATTTWFWKAWPRYVTEAEHGQQGKVIALLNSVDTEEGEIHSIYLFDLSVLRGKMYSTAAALGCPFFEPGSSPAKAWITVGRDLWEINWDSALDSGEWITLHDEKSGDMLLCGLSGKHRWFQDESHCICGQTKVSLDGVSLMGTGEVGLHTIREDNTWFLTTPEGTQQNQGEIEANSILLLHYVEGIPWIVFKSGRVRPLEGGPEYQVELPR